jgi:hypothetical protein
VEVLVRRLLGLCVCLAPILSACSFVIDFDELERGRTTRATDAGEAGATAPRDRLDAALLDRDAGDAASP